MTPKPPPKGAAWGSLDERKAAIRGVLADLATAAEAAGLPSVARDVRESRLPKLDDERYSVVVLGEFNHGKSTFINALIGDPVLPTGITPTTAVLAHISQGPKVAATLVTESGERKAVDVKKLADWLTVDGLALARLGDQRRAHLRALQDVGEHRRRRRDARRQHRRAEERVDERRLAVVELAENDHRVTLSLIHISEPTRPY